MIAITAVVMLLFIAGGVWAIITNKRNVDQHLSLSRNARVGVKIDFLKSITGSTFLNLGRWTEKAECLKIIPKDELDVIINNNNIIANPITEHFYVGAVSDSQGFPLSYFYNNTDGGGYKYKWKSIEDGKIWDVDLVTFTDDEDPFVVPNFSNDLVKVDDEIKWLNSARKILRLSLYDNGYFYKFLLKTDDLNQCNMLENLNLSQYQWKFHPSTSNDCNLSIQLSPVLLIQSNPNQSLGEFTDAGPTYKNQFTYLATGGVDKYWVQLFTDSSGDTSVNVDSWNAHIGQKALLMSKKDNTQVKKVLQVCV